MIRDIRGSVEIGLIISFHLDLSLDIYSKVLVCLIVVVNDYELLLICYCCYICCCSAIFFFLC